MPFSLPDSHVEFFERHQILELENLLSDQDADTLCVNIEALLQKRLSQKSLQGTSNALLWKMGKNIDKEEPKILKALFHLHLGKICHTVFKKRPIRIAYTQALFTEDQKDTLFSPADTLPEISSVAPLLGSLLICLRSCDPQEAPIPSLLHMKQGNAFFLSDKHPLDLPSLFMKKGVRALLVAIAPGQILYKLQPKDPHTHELKKLGYAFGDSLPEDVCSYIYR